MKLLFYIVLLIIVQPSFSQLILESLSKPTEKNAIVTTNANVSGLPFWDDFSLADSKPDSLRIWGTDTTLQWEAALSSGVFINATLAINPPTYNVATFDGLDQNGDYYIKENDAVGPADQLVSTSIDLSGKAESDNIFLSFYWQAGGNVEVPEEGDLLVLQFFRADSSDWGSVIWQAEGSENLDKSVFKQEIIRIPEEYLSKNFRFRFQSHGDLDGPFDAWHVDWVYLNEGRTNTDNGYLDRAFSGQFTSIFSPYQSIPLNQLRSNPAKFVDDQSILISNLDKIDVQPINYRHTIRELITDTELFLNNAELVMPLLRADTIQRVTLDNISLSSIPSGELLILQSEVMILDAGDGFLDGSVVFLRVNDTVRQNYILHDYYAFDDGTAEFAAGTNIKNGQVAVQYWVEHPDTLTHIDFSFPNISPILQSSAVLSLKIMSDLTENSVLRSQQITVMNDTFRNSFVRYELERPVVVSDTFYIGYQQFINDYIGIGFDRSNPEASQYIFENKDGDWIQNISLSGALMIRPVFQSGIELTLGAFDSEPIAIYPNPTKGVFSVSGEYKKIQLIDLSGKILLEKETQGLHNISEFEQGLYLLKVYQNNTYKVQRIILR